MAGNYRPQAPFDVAMKLLIPKSKVVKGVTVKTYDEYENVIFGSFRTFGGTENFSNDVVTVIDTAVIDTWYNPVIKSNCRILICETDEVYDIISSPENIGMRHQFMQFKVQKAGGKP